jgi:hypothetical protein
LPVVDAEFMRMLTPVMGPTCGTEVNLISVTPTALAPEAVTESALTVIDRDPNTLIAWFPASVECTSSMSMTTGPRMKTYRETGMGRNPPPWPGSGANKVLTGPVSRRDPNPWILDFPRAMKPGSSWISVEPDVR